MYVRGYLQGSENGRVVTIAAQGGLAVSVGTCRYRKVIGFTTTYAISASHH
jgi:hypothetical protein